jgi:hypothetical protein
MRCKTNLEGVSILKRCPKCSTKLPDDAKFCDNCGAIQPTTDKQRATTAATEKGTYQVNKPGVAQRKSMRGALVLKKRSTRIGLIAGIALLVLFSGYAPFMTSLLHPSVSSTTSIIQTGTKESVYRVTVQVVGLLSNLTSRLFVDNNYISDISSTSSRTFEFSYGASQLTHEIRIDPLVQASEDTRYVSDVYSKTISGATAVIFNYRAQYRVTVLCTQWGNYCPQFSTSLGELQANGTQWFDSSTLAVINAQYAPQKQFCPSSEDYWVWFVNGVEASRKRRNEVDEISTLTLTVDHPLYIVFKLEQMGSPLC